MKYRTIVTFNGARFEVTPDIPQQFAFGSLQLRVELVPDTVTIGGLVPPPGEVPEEVCGEVPEWAKDALSDEYDLPDVHPSTLRPEELNELGLVELASGGYSDVQTTAPATDAPSDISTGFPNS